MISVPEFRSAQLPIEYERRAAERDAGRKSDEAESIDVQCEDCGKTENFVGSLQGTVQEGPHCGGYVDVGEYDWPGDEIDDAGKDRPDSPG